MDKRVRLIFLFVLFFLTAIAVFGDTNVSSVIEDIWERIFSPEAGDTDIAEYFIILGEIGKGKADVVNGINNYLTETNFLFVSGMRVDYSIVSACIAAMMELNDSSSYPALFAVLQAGYPEVIASEAYGALNYIEGDLFYFLSGVIINNPPEEKFTAFKAGMAGKKLSFFERGQLAELALKYGLEDSEDNPDLTAMRYASVLALTELEWARASALAVRHYYRVHIAYLGNPVIKDRLIEAILCLGAVGNSEAALALGLQLGLINIRTANTGIYDYDITLAIVRSLGAIGYNGAFDHLYYAGNLPYSENIKAEARESINRLRW